MKNDKKKFDLSFDECKAIITTIDGLVVVDENGRIRYMSEDMVERIADLDKSDYKYDYINQPIEDIHPSSKLPNVLKTGETIKYAFYVVSGVTNVSTIRPILENGKLKGAVDYDFCRNNADINEFIPVLNIKLNRNVSGISDEVMNLLMEYKWPGNIRELYNTIESAMINCKEDLLKEQHFDEFFVELLKTESFTLNKKDINPLEEIRDNAEIKAIKKALVLNNNNKTKTAAFLKISRPNLYYRLKKYNIE